MKLAAYCTSILLSLSVASVALAEPVDTSQLGWIRPGVRQAEVLERLGQPDSREVIAIEHLAHVRARTLALRVSQREVWTYVGNGSVRDAVIVLDNGVVTSAARRY